jgi:hypothetical protein
MQDMQDIHVKLHLGLPRKKQHLRRRGRRGEGEGEGGDGEGEGGGGGEEEEEGSFHLLNLRNRPVKYYIWNIALYGMETWTLRKLYQKYLESFKIWYWKTTEESRKKGISYIH